MLRVKTRFFLITALLSLILLNSCRQIDLYEKNVLLVKDQWERNIECSGSFQILDTVASYKIYVVLRHRDSYQYNNIWIDLGLQSPGDTMFRQKVNLSLGNDAGWEGIGMNDIWEVRKLITPQPRRFKKAGIYTFSLRQIMRDNPLGGIVSAGLRVQKQE